MPIIGTAGWSIAKTAADCFAGEGSGLSRYASVFNGVEINSTFYRRHKTSTFARWADSVPEDFRFSVKMPKEITHLRAMKGIADLFDVFLRDIASLGRKRGPLLCQLPPSLVFDHAAIAGTFKTMREMDASAIVIEARHKSWACDAATSLLRQYSIEPVLADPAPVWPVGDFHRPPRYVRLHGNPVTYYSSYTEEEIGAFARILAADSWCIFDNTASGAATANALAMLAQTGDHILPIEKGALHR